jgi:hypothetical protein
MTATLNDVAKKKDVEQSAEQQAAAELVRLAKEQGRSLTGPDGSPTDAQQPRRRSDAPDCSASSAPSRRRPGCPAWPSTTTGSYSPTPR